MEVNPVYKDNSKITTLRDKQGVVRYTLTYLDFNQELFIVKVKEYNDTIYPKEIVREEYTDIDIASNAYHKLIDDYSAIIILDDKTAVTAEEIFDHSVNYHLCPRKSCATCKFSIKQIGKRNIFGFKYICLNENNIRSFNRILEEHKMEDCEASSYMVVHPEVSENGICKNYKKADEHCRSKFNIFRYEFHHDKDWDHFKERNHHRPDMHDIDFITDEVDVLVK